MKRNLLIDNLFHRDWLFLVLKFGEPDWSSSQWLDLWDDFLVLNYRNCRVKGITDSDWLEHIQSQDPEYIGADWLVSIPNCQGILAFSDLDKPHEL